MLLTLLRFKVGGSGDPHFFLQIYFILVQISLDVEFQPSSMLKTQITYFNPI